MFCFFVCIYLYFLFIYFIASAAHISRIEQITNTTMRRISAMRRDPDRVSSIASQLRQRFRPKDSSNTGTCVRGQGRGPGRPTFTCLQGPVSSNKTINHERLRELALGESQLFFQKYRLISNGSVFRTLLCIFHRPC